MPALALLFSVCCFATENFKHPGVFLSGEQIDYIRHQALVRKEGPVHAAYVKALNSTFAHLDAKPKGPPASGVIECGSYDKPNFGCSSEHLDSTTAYLQSLLWAINGNQTYADNAIRILNAYSSKLHKYNNSNAPLEAAWSAMFYTKAGELLAHAAPVGTNGWAKKDQEALAGMLTSVSLPLIRKGSGCNGNWELSMIDAMVGIAVFTNDTELFDHAIQFWRERLPAYFYIHTDGPYPVKVPRGSQNWNSTGRGSGSWYGQELFTATTDGVCQETCRDLGHMQMGLASALNTAETARIQGVDLYGESLDRLTAAMEFHAKILLQGSAPSYVCNGSAVQGIHSAPTFEVGYNEYSNRRNVSLPYTKQHILTQVRTMADPATELIMVYETLSHGGTPSSSLKAPHF
jgi:hypothetical protein